VRRFLDARAERAAGTARDLAATRQVSVPSSSGIGLKLIKTARKALALLNRFSPLLIGDRFEAIAYE